MWVDYFFNFTRSWDNLKKKTLKLISYLEFDFYEVKKIYYYFSKRKGKYFYTFNHFYSEKSSKRAKYHKSTTMNPNLPE